MEVVPGIHLVEGVNAHPYFINGEELVLVDAGMQKSAGRILAYLRDVLKKDPADLKTIIITHAHTDHTGGLAALVRASGAKVAVHELEAPYLCLEKRLPVPKGWMGLLFRLLSPFVRPTPVKADIILRESDAIAGMKVIHVPGHTPGSIALLDGRRKVLFPGDTLRYSGGRLGGPPARFSLDQPEALRSIGKLKGLDFDAMLAGHGEPILHDASIKVGQFRG